MILVTGAAGKTGQAVLRALVRHNKPIRALVHKNHQIQLVQGLGVHDVIAGDLRSQTRMNQVLQGIEAIYHICPNVSAEELHIGQIMIKAALSAGAGHFVYHSVLHPQIEAMPHHWQKMRVEEHLFESGIPYTILQPAPYMQNLLAYWHDIVKNRKYSVPYSEKACINSVDLEDVAEVAAIVLNESGHEGATYELCGAENLSQGEIAKIVSHYLGYRIHVEVVPVEDWAVKAQIQGLGDYQVETLAQMFRYYDRFGLVGNARVMECLLHRPATSYATFMERTVREHQE